MKRLLILALLISLAFPKATNEELIKDIKQSLMAPCCWSGTVYDHGHSKVESEIEEFVEQGKSKDQIMKYFANVYGERILAIPVARGFNLFAWIVPVIIAGIGIFILIMFIRSPKSKEPKIISQNDGVLYSDEIEKELAEMD
ncbi:MAG: cytochrome c-type biogenesis protein CcmH [Candidatus Marinimicrobia bacterium]|nr:cytochrome c-type biogenesis protein CcmH [Candidatus Neomarinimicrobiota bacterium]